MGYLLDGSFDVLVVLIDDNPIGLFYDNLVVPIDQNMIDDNLVVPVSAGVVIWLIRLVF